MAEAIISRRGPSVPDISQKAPREERVVSESVGEVYSSASALPVWPAKSEGRYNRHLQK